MAGSSSSRLALLRYAARSVWLHRLRAVLSTLGIVCGVISFVAMISLSEGAKRETLAQIEQLGLRNVLVKSVPLSPEQLHRVHDLGSAGLSTRDADRLRAAVEGVRRVAAVREVAATVVQSGRESSPQVIAVTADFIGMQRLEVAAGRALADDDERSRRLVCILGQGVARALGESGRPGSTLRIEGAVCRVVGVLSRFERKAPKNAAIAVRDYDNAVLLPLGAELAFAGDEGRVTEIVAEMGSPEAVMRAVPSIRRTMEVAHRGADDFRIVAPQELLAQANQARRNFDLLMGAIAAVSLVVGGIGVMNVMLASVTERTAEIGLRRAVGATSRHIASQFLAEATVLTGVGGLAGVALGVAGVGVASLAFGWPVALDAWAVALPLMAAVASGLFFGLYPALQAARLDPMAALRHG